MADPVRKEVPQLIVLMPSGQHYAHAHGARLRWKVRRLSYDWAVITHRGHYPGWGFEAQPKDCMPDFSRELHTLYDDPPFTSKQDWLTS